MTNFYTKDYVAGVTALTEEQVANKLERVFKRQRELLSMKKKDLKELVQQKYPKLNLKGKDKFDLVKILYPVPCDDPLVNRGRELAQRYNGYLRPQPQWKGLG